MRNLLVRFSRDRRGAVALLFGLTLIPILGAAGGAIDYSLASRRKAVIQNALDAATLTMAKAPPVDDDTLKVKVSTLVADQLRDTTIKASEWTITGAHDSGRDVTATLQTTVKTAFIGLFGIHEMTWSESSQVVREMSALELALVMDNTGSMESNDKIGALRSAVTVLIDEIYKDPANATKVKIALVPFVTTVNVKVPGVYDPSWMDVNAQSQWHGANFDLVGGAKANHFTLFNDLGTTWKGCVEARAEPYDLDITPPNPAVPNSLYVPWFWPDEPDRLFKPGPTEVKYVNESGTPRDYAYQNNYLKDGISGYETDSAPARQRNTVKYSTQASTKVIDDVPAETSGPNKSCPEPLTPLTNDYILMKQKVAAMMPWHKSGTNIALGMVWGWNLLSKEAPFTEGAPDDDLATRKAMIVLTDGENVVFGGYNTHNKSDYTGYNYLAKNRLGTTNKDTAAANVNTKVTAMCQKIKAKKIRLYTITFNLPAGSIQSIFRDCATEPKLYFDSPTEADLQNIFKQIAVDLTSLRVAQ